MRVSCPTHQELVSFVLGKLSDDVCHRIAQHLESCPTCQANIVRVDDRADSLVIRLRNSRGGNATSEQIRPSVTTPPTPPSEPDIKIRTAPKGKTTGGRRSGVKRRRASKTSVKINASLSAGTRPNPLVGRRVAKFRRRKMSSGAKACYLSGLMHAGLIAILGILTLQAMVVGSPFISLVVDPVSDDLDGENSFAFDLNVLPADSPDEGQDARDAIEYDSPRPDLFGDIDGPEIDLPSVTPEVFHGTPTERGTIGLPGMLKEDWMRKAPDKAPSNPREITNSYESALHLLAQDIHILLEDSSVLLVWCLDRSESMKDDRATVHRQLDRVYDDLVKNRPKADFMVRTAVTSFGSRFHDHTEQRPVNDKRSVLQNIGSIGSENSGKEHMCSAALNIINRYGRFAQKRRHRMVLALVTDESGDDKDNRQFLEPLIKIAKAANVRIYIFGREAAFGHRTAFVFWHNPETRNTHQLEIDLGPESPFDLEQLLIDGIGHREDAHPSGFGPYDQCRIVKETGGRFFLLPGRETNLSRGTTSKYSLEAVSAYEPFLGSRNQYIKEHLQRDLPRAIAKIVYRFHPRHHKDVTLRRELSSNFAEFRKEVVEEYQKSRHIITLMDHNLAILEEHEPDRDRERSPRWQANYDLLKAQLALYRFRLQQYVAYLNHHPQVPPVPPADNNFLWSHQVAPRAELIEGTSRQELAKVRQMLIDVEEEHPGTPWAARAEWERRRGFGMALIPNWRTIQRELPTVTTPKL